jgi:hypothetical protein
MRFKCGYHALIVVAVCVVFGACGSADKASSKPIPRQEGTELGRDQAASLEALVDSVMARARRGDTLGLVRLMVDDSVYRHAVYPLSDAYDSTREDVFEFVLGFHKLNTVKGLKGLLFDVSETPDSKSVGDYSHVKIFGGGFYEAKALERGVTGIRPFGSAVCLSFGCQVVSYGSAGLVGRGPQD